MRRVWVHSTSVAVPTDVDVVDGPLLDLMDCSISLSWHGYAGWSGYTRLSSSCEIPHISSVVLRCPGLTLRLKPAERLKYGIAVVPYVTEVSQQQLLTLPFHYAFLLKNLKIAGTTQVAVSCSINSMQRNMAGGIFMELWFREGLDKKNPRSNITGFGIPFFWGWQY